MYCWKCGTENDDNAFMCVQCGQILRKMPQAQQEGQDELGGAWVAVIWLSLLIPFLGQWVIVILSSAMYYHWKKTYPQKAKSINRHGWLAFFAGHIVWLLILFQFGGCGALLNR